MNRDHMLGWPPSLLALDEVEPTCHRRPAATATSVPVTRTWLSQAEQDQRAERDRSATAMLDAPVPAPVIAKEYTHGTPQVVFEGRITLTGASALGATDGPKYPKYFHHTGAMTGLWYRLDQDGHVHIGNGSPGWRRAQWTADKLFVPVVVEITEAELPAHLRTHKTPVPSTEYRVRKNGDNIYRLRDGHVEYWHRFGKCWRRPDIARNWDIMIPAPESAIAALPAEALNT